MAGKSGEWVDNSMKKAIILGVVSFIVSTLIFGSIFPHKCRDGWITSSSGRGTCSHHGGTSGGWGGILSLVIGLAVFFITVSKNKK